LTGVLRISSVVIFQFGPEIQLKDGMVLEENQKNLMRADSEKECGPVVSGGYDYTKKIGPWSGGFIPASSIFLRGYVGREGGLPRKMTIGE